MKNSVVGETENLKIASSGEYRQELPIVSSGSICDQSLGRSYFSRGARVRNRIAPRKAAPGIVNSHAHTMFRVTPHGTAVKRRDAPTPTMAPVIVCVVLTGMPK